jgi:hypothetical protein
MVKFNPVEDYQANMFLKRVLDNPKAFDAVDIVICVSVTQRSFS